MDQVTNIMYSVTGPNSVLVTWDVVTGATSYLVEVRSNNTTLQSMSVAVPEVPLDALELGKLYEVLIVPTDGVVEGDRNRHVVYLSVKDWLPRVTNLAYTELVTRDGFTVTWDPSASATSYRLIAEAYDDNTLVYDGPASSPYTLSGLVPEKLYRVSVIPVNGAQEGITAVIVGWVQPVVEDGKSTKTSHLLFPATTQGSYNLLYRPYIENMRPLREEPNYWRFIDTVSYARGSEVLNQTPTPINYIWVAKAEGTVITIARQDALANVVFTLDVGEAIKSVSLIFDQLGASILGWETETGVYLRTYDYDTNQFVTKDLGLGLTPHVATDYFLAPTPTDWSERFVFFIRQTNNEIVYYRQSEQYLTEHVYPVTEGTLLELLEVGPSYYGVFLIAAVIRETDGTIRVLSVAVPKEPGNVVLSDLATTEKFGIALNYAGDTIVFSQEVIQEEATGMLAFPSSSLSELQQTSVTLDSFVFESTVVYTDLTYSETPVSQTQTNVSMDLFEVLFYGNTEVNYEDAPISQTQTSVSLGALTITTYTFRDFIPKDEDNISTSQTQVTLDAIVFGAPA